MTKATANGCEINGCPPSLAQIEGALEAVAEVEAVVSEDVRLLEARSDAFAVETRPGEIWITGE